MGILPQGAIIDNETSIVEVTLSSITYKIDFEKKRIVGFCDGIEALKQAIFLILETERYEHIIYSWDYGAELKTLIGNDRSISESEYKRRITEALLQDDRIENVDNFIFKYEKDSVLIEFTVFSSIGSINIERREYLV